MKRVIVLALTAAVCAYATYAFAYTPYFCDRRLTTLLGRTKLAAGTSNSIDAILLARRNLTDLRSLESRCRCRVLLYTLQAENEYLLGRKEEAIDALRRGLLVEKRPEIYMGIGSVLVELGRMDEAVEHFVLATRFSAARVVNIASPEARRRVEERLQQITAQGPK